jgi:hypothetical protein
MGGQRGSHDIVSRRLAVLLIFIGVVFAVDSVLGLSVAHKLWPLLLTILAAGLIGIYVKRNARDGVFLASGVYLLCFSGLALYCSFTSWATLAELWPLFIAFLGIVFLALFFARGRNRWFLLLGLLLLSAAVVFWLFLALSGRFWWIVFVLVGVSLLASERAGWRPNE